MNRNLEKLHLYDKLTEFSKDEVMKRNIYNKLENLAKLIKEKMQSSLGQDEKEKILKYITLIIISFQVDNIYKKTTETSGILSILKLFGFEEEKAIKIKALCNGGANVALLAILIFKNLKR